MSEERDYSLKTESIIDDEINLLLRTGDINANELLKTHDKELEGITQFLLEHETIDSEQFIAIIEGRDPLKASPIKTDDPTPPPEETVGELSRGDEELGNVNPEPQAT